MSKGLFLAFEGMDGCGKSTQLDLMARYLAGLKGQSCEVFRDPGSTDLGENLRLILTDGDIKASHLQQILLFTAARAGLVDQVRACTDKGVHVLVDRWLLSTYAYQVGLSGDSRDCRAEVVNRLHRTCCGNLNPNTTIVLDVTAEEALARMHKRGEPADRFESGDLAYYRGLRRNYAAKRPLCGRVVCVKGDGTPEEVHARVRLSLLDECHSFAAAVARDALAGS